VAVPSLDYGRFLDRCLHSIDAQDHGDFEVLIADGGSTDESLSVISRYTQHDRRFRLVSTADQGQADALNRAMAVATGDVACFLNADDVYVREDVFKTVVEILESRPDVDVVTMGGYYLDAEGSLQHPIELRNRPLDLDSMRSRGGILQPATFWRRSIAVGRSFRTDLQYVFDALFFYELFLDHRWLERPDRVAGYRLHRDNKSLQVSALRVHELAELETVKYGQGNARVRYLRRLVRLLSVLDRLHPAVAATLKQATYVAVNATSVLTARRWPSI
jgi:glycosyltransferase involved in cell wall biosynthesis